METKERNTLTIHLPKELKREAKRYALDNDKTLTQIVVELLEREIKTYSGRRVREQKAPYATAGQ
jgi:hypothetical protein